MKLPKMTPVVTIFLLGSLEMLMQSNSAAQNEKAASPASRPSYPQDNEIEKTFSALLRQNLTLSGDRNSASNRFQFSLEATSADKAHDKKVWRVDLSCVADRLSIVTKTSSGHPFSIMSNGVWYVFDRAGTGTLFKISGGNPMFELRARDGEFRFNVGYWSNLKTPSVNLDFTSLLRTNGQRQATVRSDSQVSIAILTAHTRQEAYLNAIGSTVFPLKSWSIRRDGGSAVVVDLIKITAPGFSGPISLRQEELLRAGIPIKEMDCKELEASPEPPATFPAEGIEQRNAESLRAIIELYASPTTKPS